MEKVSESSITKIVADNKDKPVVIVLKKKKKKEKKSVTWDGAVVDNEFMDKKKSNKCCMYHKPRRWDESDTDETSSDDDASSHAHKTQQSKHQSIIATQTQTQTSAEKPELHVTWDESVVDNEFMNKKKSNKCCIFHKRRRWDESDSEDSDSAMEDKEPEQHKDADAKESTVQTGAADSNEPCQPVIEHSLK